MNKRNSVLLVFAVIGILFAGFMFFQGDPYSSRTAPVTNDYIQNPVQISPLSPPIYTDDFDGANDTTALKARGYKVWYRGGGPQGPVATWFQGNSTVFSAFNGPATGYVAANYQIVTGANPIDSWLVLPYMSGGLQVGDSLYFYSRSPSASTFPDSIRVMVSANDSTPEGTWTELGRFKVTTSGSWERRGFKSTLAGPNARFAIRYCVVDGGPSGNNSDFIGIDALTIVRTGSQVLYAVPEMMYYKFENNTPTATPNYASAPVGTNPALLTGSCVFTTGGQFDSCISGSAGAGAGLNTGWNTAMPTNWTISFWLGPNQVDANPSYLWGDNTAGSFRCFYGGAAYPNNILFRGGFTDILITGVNPTATVVTLVYNGTNVVVYKNGVLFNTFPRTITANGSAPFKVAGYSTSSSISGKMDEFRMYNRALTAAEVLATWNQELPILVGTNNNQNNVPSAYNLSQNYPNPFNPSTKISYTLPKAGIVKLVVFDILGKEVATLVNGTVTAGTHDVNFDASRLSSGVYFYKIVAGDFTATKKMILVK